MKVSFLRTLAFVFILAPACMVATNNSNPEPQKPPVVSVQSTQQRSRLCPLTAIKNMIVAHPRFFYTFLTVSFLAGAGVGGYYLYKNIILEQENEKDTQENEVAQESTGNELADRLAYCNLKNLE